MPRWWRRLLVALRRANVFLLLEMTAGTALITMLAVSWQTVSANSATSCCRRGSLRCC
jgi:two-component system nitrogen regulation sensor histidine kinase NtrY